MGKKVEYKKEPRETSDGSANVDIEFPPVDIGYKLTIQHISAEDETTDFTELRIGYLKDERRHWWVEEKNPEAATLYWTSDSKVLTEHMKLVIRFTGTTDQDKLVAYVDGYTEKVVD